MTENEEKLESELASFLAGCIVVYLFISAICLLGGIINAEERSCTGKMTRIKYVFPAHAAGCWLGSAPKSEDENERRIY